MRFRESFPFFDYFGYNYHRDYATNYIYQYMYEKPLKVLNILLVVIIKILSMTVKIATNGRRNCLSSVLIGKKLSPIFGETVFKAEVTSNKVKFLFFTTTKMENCIRKGYLQENNPKEASI